MPISSVKVCLDFLCPTGDQMKLTFIALALFTLLSSCGGRLPLGL
jgi:hypothetical protein